MKTLQKLFLSLLAVLFMSLFLSGPLAGFFDITPREAFSVCISFNFILNLVVCVYLLMTGGYRSVKHTGALYELLSEMWLNLLLEHLIPAGSYLRRSRDMAAWIANNVLHYAETGDLPQVLIDNTVFPLPYTPRVDNPLTAQLHYFNTLPTTVNKAEAMQLAYPKLESVIAEHRRSLFLQILKYITYQWFPAQETAFLPVSGTSGKIVGSAQTYLSPSDNTKLAFTPQDFAAQQKNLIDLYVPEEPGQWVSVLCTQHRNDLASLDTLLFKKFQDQPTGTPINMNGFEVYTSPVTPIYNGSTGKKIAMGSTGDGNNVNASLFYYVPEMYMAMGTAEMFAHLNNPAVMGDTIAFGQFATGGSVRNKYACVVYSGIAA